jgi:hypothetical protein
LREGSKGMNEIYKEREQVGEEGSTEMFFLERINLIFDMKPWLVDGSVVRLLRAKGNRTEKTYIYI